MFSVHVIFVMWIAERENGTLFREPRFPSEKGDGFQEDAAHRLPRGQRAIFSALYFPLFLIDSDL
jgi:hypothetical protein